jgi:hypothetical protein
MKNMSRPNISSSSDIFYLKEEFFMEKNMKENFDKLEKRLFNALYNTDLEKIRYELKKIDSPTLVSGVGGSNTVSNFTTNVLNKTNKIITRNTEPRDFKYMNLNGYKNVIACSYSGDNYGVKLAFDNNLKHYLLSGSKSNNTNVIPLYYELKDDKEKSFISLSSTIIPCAILLDYYLSEQNYSNPKEKIIFDFNEYDYNFNTNCDCYEIFSGCETSSASNFLESTMIESGITVPIVHDKYSYCHGRSTLSINKNNIAIYFNNNTELDKLMLNELPKYYKDIIVLNKSTNDNIINEFILLNKCIYLVKYIADFKNKDLSGIDYNPIVKKLYKYKGDL